MTDDLISRTELYKTLQECVGNPETGDLYEVNLAIQETPTANETQVILEALRTMREICKKHETCLECPLDGICGFFTGCPCKYAFNINLFAEAQYKLEQEAAKKKEEAAYNGEPSFKGMDV